MSNPTFDKAKGRVEQAAGDLTGDEDLERKGHVDEKVAEAKEKLGQITERIEGAIDDAKEKVKDLIDRD